MIVVFNPTAGRRRAQLLWRVLDVMVANGMRLELVKTTQPRHAEALARCAAEAGARMIVAAGGDGTIAEVASGLLGSDAKLGVIPLGTANVLAHELALPFTPQAVAAALAFGRTRRIWPGVMVSPEGSRLFVQMLGVGFDAQVVHHLSPRLKRVCGRAAYVLQTLRELPRYRFDPIRVKVDEKEYQASSVVLTKGCLYAGQYRLALDAHPSEPGFSVVLFQRAGAGAAMVYGAALPLNMLPHTTGICRVRALKVEIRSVRQMPAQADGDAAGFAPLTVTDAPVPIPIVIG